MDRSPPVSAFDKNKMPNGALTVTDGEAWKERWRGKRATFEIRKLRCVRVRSFQTGKSPRTCEEGALNMERLEALPL